MAGGGKSRDMAIVLPDDRECRRTDMAALPTKRGGDGPWSVVTDPQGLTCRVRCWLAKVETETPLERSLDPATVAWLQNLTTAGPVRENAEQRLHALLLRACRAELGRRAPRAGLTGPDVD